MFLLILVLQKLSLKIISNKPNFIEVKNQDTGDDCISDKPNLFKIIIMLDMGNLLLVQLLLMLQLKVNQLFLIGTGAAVGVISKNFVKIIFVHPK